MGLAELLEDDRSVPLLFLSLVGYILFSDLLQEYVQASYSTDQQIVGVVVIAFIIIIYVNTWERKGD